jgi:glucan phosphoethanolaminetransferase (alkaline phosphatase superfamily)
MQETQQEQQKIRTTPSDFFLHLGIIVALYISAINLVNLLFDIINKISPDALNYYYDTSAGSIRFAVASLIIMFPLYIILGWIYNKQLAATPEKKTLGIRKWLVYFTLFISGLTLAIDLIFLVYNLLGGETTTPFILKVLAVFMVAGLIFAYYLTDIRSRVENHGKLIKIFRTLSIIIVLTSIIAGFVYVGSPAQQRKLRFDEQRVQNLQTIQWQVINYWQQKGKLPSQITDLHDSISNFSIPQDPETQNAYTYTQVATTAFKLCAMFDLASVKNNNGGIMPQSYPAMNMNGQDNWQHVAGPVCFDRVLDPQLYPVKK